MAVAPDMRGKDFGKGVALIVMAWLRWARENPDVWRWTAHPDGQYECSCPDIDACVIGDLHSYLFHLTRDS